MLNRQMRHIPLSKMIQIVEWFEIKSLFKMTLFLLEEIFDNH